MRILPLLFSFFLLTACDPIQTNKPDTPPPVVNKRVGIYKNATIYTGRSDYEFEVEGKSMLIRLSNFDSANQPMIPSNLTISRMDGLPGPNPLLIGKKFTLSFAPQEQLLSIKLLDAHDPSDGELPAIPDNYSSLLAYEATSNNRAYLNIFSDLTAILLINDETRKQPIYKYGRWTRTDNGQKVNIQFGEDIWEFLIRENALVLISQQMGSEGFSFIATEEYSICQYLKQWLSELSSSDNKAQIAQNYITNESNLADILRTEQAYSALYKDLENTYQIEAVNIEKTLRKDPTVQGICDLVLRNWEGGH